MFEKNEEMQMALLKNYFLILINWRIDKQAYITLACMLCSLSTLAQQKKEGTFYTREQFFVPNDSAYTTVKIQQAGFGKFLHKGKCGIMNKEGGIVTLPVYDEIIVPNTGKCFVAIQHNNQQYSNYFERWLIHADSIATPKKIYWYYGYNNDVFKQNHMVILQDSNYYIVNNRTGMFTYGPSSYPIKLAEPYGFLVAGKPDTTPTAMHKKRMMGGSDIYSYAYYDSNFVQKTSYTYKELKYNETDSFFTSISDKGKGIMDYSGKEIIPPVMDRAYYTRDKQYIVAEFDGMADVELHDGMGFAGTHNSQFQLYHADGTLLIQDTFKDYKNYIPHDKLFIVVRDGDYNIYVPKPEDEVRPAGMLGYVKNPGMNLLTASGTYVLPKNVSHIDFIKNGYYLLEKENRFFIYNLAEKKEIPLPYKRANVYWPGFVSVRDGNDKEGLLTMKGALWQNKTFKNITIGIDVAAVSDGKQVMLIDKNFATLIPFGKYDSIEVSAFSRFGNEYTLVAKRTGSTYAWGVLDKNYKELLAPVYDEIQKDDNSTFKFVVKQKGKYGIHNNKGKNIVPCIYENSIGYNDNFNRVGVSYKGQYVLLDSTGKMPLYEGFACNYNSLYFTRIGVNAQGEYNLINALNKKVLKENVDDIALANVHDYFFVSKKGKKGIVNSRGMYILPIEWDTITYNFPAKKFEAIKNNERYNIDLLGKITMGK